MGVLICPVCKEELEKVNKSYICKNNHSFDLSKDGYVNLLLGSKNGENRGDSKDSARARHQFLAKGYYGCLKEKISSLMVGTVLDICCGEGYYDEYDGEFYGFDISKEMVRLASKSNKSNNYFVANLSSIPVKDGSIDTAIHLFAPFNEKEFSRILSNDGALYSVIPGEEHLWELKNILYDTPYKNDEKAPEVQSMKFVGSEKITQKVKIGKEDLKTLFSMTPYFYHTSEKDKAKLDLVDEIELTVQFVVLKYCN